MIRLDGLEDKERALHHRASTKVALLEEMQALILSLQQEVEALSSRISALESPSSMGGDDGWSEGDRNDENDQNVVSQSNSLDSASSFKMLDVIVNDGGAIVDVKDEVGLVSS